MTAWRQTLEIARWDLLRFFKWRDVVLAAALVAVVTGVQWAAQAWQRSSRTEVRVAVISPLPIHAGAGGGDAGSIALEPRGPADEAALRDEVADGKRDGLVVVDTGAAPPTVRLIVRKEPVWLGELSVMVRAAIQAHRLGELGVAPAKVAAALAPVPIALELTAGSHSGSAKLAALILILGMLLALLLGNSYLFMSITGEKQQRATEQLFTMATPQVLIDGKLLGVAALALIAMLQMVAIALVTWQGVSASSLAGVVAALGGIRAGELAVLLGFTIAGTAFWMTATAAVFATIDDPNSSARSSIMLLPMLPLSIAFIGFSSPDSTMMQVLSFVPITSMTVVPARLVLGEIGTPAIAISFAILVVAIWLLRRGVARIYEAAMLMYGKEPSFVEMARWFRRARG